MFVIDTRQIKSYQTRPERIEAILLDSSNIEEAALWCGGEVHRSNGSYLEVPALGESIIAERGVYLYKNNDTGRFGVMTSEEFGAKGFYEVGLRQDGPGIPRTGTINVNRAGGSGEAYGDYPDYRHKSRDVLDMS